MTNQLEIKLLSDNATMPTRDRLDAGYDIYSAETLILEPQEKAVIKTDGEHTRGYVGLLTSRSGVSSKTHLVIETGKIDAGYQGNLGINIKNDYISSGEYELAKISEVTAIKYPVYGITNQLMHYSQEYYNPTYQINKGDKLAQLVIVPIWTPELKEVEEFSYVSERGQTGLDQQDTKDILEK